MKLVQAVKRLQFLENEIQELEEAVSRSLVTLEGGDNFVSADECSAKMIELINERRFLKVAITRTNISTAVKIDMTDGSEQQITVQELIYLIDDNVDQRYRLQRARDIVLDQPKAVSLAFDVSTALSQYSFIKERLQYLQDMYTIVQYKQDLME